jgi:hypothetical protein
MFTNLTRHRPDHNRKDPHRHRQRDRWAPGLWGIHGSHRIPVSERLLSPMDQSVSFRVLCGDMCLCRRCSRGVRERATSIRSTEAGTAVRPWPGTTRRRQTQRDALFENGILEEARSERGWIRALVHFNIPNLLATSN